MSPRATSIHERKLLTMPILVLIMIITAACSATMAYSSLREADTKIATLTAQHEERLKSVETKTEDIATMKNDIAWMKRTMEAQERRAGRATPP